jgi:hypothetical protein
MGDVVAFPTKPGGHPATPERPAAAADTTSPALAQLRQSIAQLHGARLALAAGARSLTASFDRLGEQRNLFERRTEMSRAIERAAGRLDAAIAVGELAALERLVPEFEALARAAATDDRAAAEAATPDVAARSCRRFAPAT